MSGKYKKKDRRLEKGRLYMLDQRLCACISVLVLENCIAFFKLVKFCK